MIVEVENHGPLLISTNFWDTDLARNGKVFASTNAGAIRLLLPPARYRDLDEMRTSKYCVLSRGPWAAEGKPEGIEIMFEDGSDSPYAIHLTPESFDMLPAEPVPGKEWVLTVWLAKDGRPHKSLERLCHWRRVGKIPCMQPWRT